ncbi:MAG: hypothetical protein ACR2J3_05340, partial [Aridibacter sp.]
MKRLPKCNNTYSDANLNYCLTDGELLISDNNFTPSDSVQTVFLSPNNSTTPNNTNFFVFTEITQELISIVECWCYEQHTDANDSCNERILDWTDLS